MARALVLGFLVGFPIALSPGPIFFLVLRRTLARGWRSGFVSGLGVATGDATYAAVAAFGVAAVTTVLLAERHWIGLMGGIAIALIGLRTLRERPLPGPAHAGNPATLTTMAPPQPGEGKLQTPRDKDLTPAQAGEGNRQGGNRRGGREFVSILALTLSNPSTILSFTAVFAGLGIHVAGGWAPELALVVGVLLGSLAWWVVLTGVASRLRERVTPSIIRGFGLLSGFALLGFGVVTIGVAVRG